MRQNVTPQHVDPSLGQPTDPDLLDQELVRWFALHGCAWSGTSGELLRTLKIETSLSTDVLPASAEVLYAHIAAHRQLLQSSGIEVTLGQGYPRIVSLRSSPNQEPEQVSSSGVTQGKSEQASAAEHHFESKVADSPSPINPRSEQAAAKNVEGVLYAINDVQEQIRKRVKEFPISPVRNKLSNAAKSDGSSCTDASARNPSAD